MTIEKRIKMLLTYSDITQVELARRLNMSPANLNNKLRRNRLMYSEVEDIAKALGVKLIVTFELEDGSRI